MERSHWKTQKLNESFLRVQTQVQRSLNKKTAYLNWEISQQDDIQMRRLTWFGHGWKTQTASNAKTRSKDLNSPFTP